MREIVCLLLTLFGYVLFARILLSWFRNIPEGLRPIVRVIFMLTEPIMRWVRPLIPPVRIGAVALDLSILLIFFLLRLLQGAFC